MKKFFGKDMSGLLKAKLQYDVDFSPAIIRQLATVLRSAVYDNWKVRDEWSTPAPEPDIDVDQWLEQSATENMRYSELFGYWTTNSLFFPYSPLSSWHCSVDLIREHDERFTVLLLITEAAKYEIQGERELDRMKMVAERISGEAKGGRLSQPRSPLEDPESEEWAEKEYQLWRTPNVWPQNKKCLQHIIEKLKCAFPVRALEINPELLNGEGSHGRTATEQQP